MSMAEMIFQKLKRLDERRLRIVYHFVSGIID